MQLTKEIESKFIVKPQEEEALVEFITNVLDLDYEERKEWFKQNKFDFGTNIIKFFQLPRSPLHAQFKEKICAKSLEENQKRKSIRYENKIKSNITKAYQDERTRDNDSIDLNYYIIKQFDLVTWDSIVQIGIPYQKKIDKIRSELKFAYQELISMNDAKQFYEMVMDNYPKYSFSY